MKCDDRFAFVLSHSRHWHSRSLILCGTSVSCVVLHAFVTIFTRFTCDKQHFDGHHWTSMDISWIMCSTRQKRLAETNDKLSTFFKCKFLWRGFFLPHCRLASMCHRPFAVSIVILNENETPHVQTKLGARTHTHTLHWMPSFIENNCHWKKRCCRRCRRPLPRCNNNSNSTHEN